MNSDTSPSHDLERQPSHGYASSGSESRRPSGKKRASRAGTRSVTTLSAAQLERKRANDREAQRAIRQRTKDHIDNLEKSINDLRGSQESNEQLVAATQQRNQELEEENAYLRSKLGGTGYGQRASDAQLLSVNPTSPLPQASTTGSSIQRPPSSSTPRSLSVATSLSSNSRHSSFQQQGGFLPSGSSSALSMPSTGAAVGPPLTAWRSHDGGHGVQALQHAPILVPDPVQTQAPVAYNQPNPSQPTQAYGQSNAPQRIDWTPITQPYQYSTQEQQQPQKYETQPPSQPPPPQQQQTYVQTPVQSFAAVPQTQAYHPPQMPPQAEFQNMAVSSPAAYQMQHQQQAYQQPQQQAYPQTYSQPSTYQMTPVQLPASAAEYTSPHGQMQPPSLPTGYQPPPQEQHYVSQQPHTPMQYRDDSASRSYGLNHYPPG